MDKVFYFQALASVLGVASEIKDEVAKLGSARGAEANGRERAKVYFPKYLFCPSEITHVLCTPFGISLRSQPTS